MHEQHEREPAEALELVEHELREPLLVDPRTPVRPDRQRVVRGKPVLGYHPPRQERHPAVGRKRRAEVCDQDSRERGDHDDDRPVLLQPR